MTLILWSGTVWAMGINLLLSNPMVLGDRHNEGGGTTNLVSRQSFAPGGSTALTDLACDWPL